MPLVSSVPEMRGPKMLKRSCDYNHAHLGTFFYPRHAANILNHYTKFEDSNFCCFGDVKEDQKVKIRGDLRWLLSPKIMVNFSIR